MWNRALSCVCRAGREFPVRGNSARWASGGPGGLSADSRPGQGVRACRLAPCFRGDDFPAVDFLLYGVDERSWQGPRWLDFLEGQAAAPTWALWLQHGFTPAPDPTRPWLRVGNLPRARHARLMTPDGGDRLPPPGGTVRSRLEAARPPDYLTRLAASELGRAAKRLVIDELAVEPGATVVDLGCGPGVDLPALAGAVGRRGRVLGIDSDRCAIAEAAAVSSAYAETEVQVADIHRLPMADRSVDRVHTDRELQHVSRTLSQSWQRRPGFCAPEASPRSLNPTGTPSSSTTQTPRFRLPTGDSSSTTSCATLESAVSCPQSASETDYMRRA